VIVTVKVLPRSSKPGITIEADRSLKVRLHSPPVDGAANAELVEVLAEAFGLPRRAVAIVGGARSRTKRVQIEGMDELPGAISGESETPQPRRTPRR
jgi:uncharacterized protein